MVPEAQIQEILISERSLSSACKTLVDSANKNGGKDNISALLVQF
jgi:protein phosphatase